ncbi:MAG: ABC transporter ATP-binding protein [bacterium]
MRLRLINLRKEFVSLRRSVLAVDGVDLGVNHKEFFVLLGPSGCGKSTVLNLIAGLERPTDGEVWFGERLVASSQKRVFLTPRERNVAMVFQTYALYPHLNVHENIAFPLRIMKERDSVIKEAVKEAAGRLKILDLLSARPAELSGGQRQRVAIARAIVRRPDLFLLDEPLSNLDAQLRASTRTELKRLQRSLGITTVYVTHDQVEAMTLGDRIAVLKDGGIEQVGTPEELYDVPANTFVAGFIGSPPMNQLEGSLAREEGASYVLLGEKRIEMPHEKTGRLENLSPGPCTFGIRPEHVHVSRTRRAGQFEGIIVSVEPMGREIILHISIGQNAVSALSTDAEFKENEKVYVEFDLTKAHIFEA